MGQTDINRHFLFYIVDEKMLSIKLQSKEILHYYFFKLILIEVLFSKEISAIAVVTIFLKIKPSAVFVERGPVQELWIVALLCLSSGRFQLGVHGHRGGRRHRGAVFFPGLVRLRLP